LWQAVAMIGVFVGNQNAIEPVKFLFNGYQPRQRLSFSQPGINEKASLLSFEQCAIARAS